MLIERQQHCLVQFAAVELAIGDESVGRPDHLQFLRALGAAKAVDIAAGMQIDLAPDADRIKRHLDLLEPLGGRALAPERVIGRMLLQEEVQIAGLLARMLAVRRMAIDDAVLVPPIAAEEIPQHAALIDRGAVGIVEPVEGGDAGKRRRLLDRHPPLQHAEIGLADAADLAVRPRLMAEPFDDVIKIFLFVLVEEAKFAARLAAAAHVHMRIDIATFDIEFDRPGLAPQKLRRRRQRIVVIAIRRRRQQHRKWAVALRHEQRHRDLDAVMDADFDFAAFGLCVCHCFSPRQRADDMRYGTGRATCTARPFSPHAGRSTGGLRPPSSSSKNADAKHRLWMRGPLRWAQTTKLRLAERPPHPRSLRSLDLSPHAGRGKAIPCPRRIRARVLPRQSLSQAFPTACPENIEGGGAPVGALF